MSLNLQLLNKILYQTCLHFLIKPKFRLDIILYYLNFFKSISLAYEEIKNKKVYVNNSIVYPNYFLKCGDIITFNTDITNIIFNLKYNFCSFLEIDYYTKTILIIKNFDELSENDICIINTKYFEIKKLFDIIRYQ